MDGEAVILDVETGEYFSLNPVATTIWTLLDEGCPISDLARRVAVRYGVEVEVAGRDVDELLSELRSNRLWDGA